MQRFLLFIYLIPFFRTSPDPLKHKTKRTDNNTWTDTLFFPPSLFSVNLHRVPVYCWVSHLLQQLAHGRHQFLWPDRPLMFRRHGDAFLDISKDQIPRHDALLFFLFTFCAIVLALLICNHRS